MQEATLYIGGFFGAIWTGLVLFVGIRSFILSAEQIRIEKVTHHLISKSDKK